MKRTTIMLAALLVATVATAPLAQQEKPWFDMDNCAFCKHFKAEPGLMDNVTFEYHDLSNGVMSITHVPEDYKEAMGRAQANMMEAAQIVDTTVQMITCGHCDAYGKFMTAGVKFESIQSKLGEINLMTSDDPETVAKLQKFGKRNAEEYTKVHKSEKPESQD